MFVPDKNTFVARAVADIPQRALTAVRPQLAALLGRPVGEMFPEFADSFPLAVAGMEAHWSRPALAVTDMGRDWVANLFLEKDERNLFLNNPFPPYASEPDFNAVVLGMVPSRWIGLYRSMESFTTTDKSHYSPVGWRNTPLPRSIDVDRFSSEANTNKAKIEVLEKRLEITQPRSLRCWMLTDARDSLWIDEQHCDKKVYHVHADDFADAYALPDPGSTLDQYLAQVVSGSPAKAFDFRAGV